MNGITFGGTDPSTIPGVTALLTGWPTADARMETVDLLNGVWHGRTGRAASTATVAFRLEADSAQAVLALRDTLQQIFAPNVLDDLTSEEAPGWVWHATPSTLVTLTREIWRYGSTWESRAEVSLLIPDGCAYANPDETATGATSATITRTVGNSDSYPTITVLGDFDGVTVTIDGTPVKVDIPVTSAQRLVLDYQSMDLSVWTGSTKTAHAAAGMSDLTRYSLPMGSTTITASPLSGTVTSITVTANSRRL